MGSKKDMKTGKTGNAIVGVVLASVATSSVARADDKFEGLYGAIEAGVGIVKQEGTTFLGPIDETEETAIIGAVVGARTDWGDDKQTVFGLEAGGDLYTDSSQWRYGIYGLAGRKIRGNDLAYVRVGYGKFNGDTQDLEGMVLGAGYELELNKRTSLRFDYKALFYGDVNFVDNAIDYQGHEVTMALVFHPWAN